MSRRRCDQDGFLFKRGKRKKVWVGRWREDVIGPDNQMSPIRRSQVLGTVQEIPTRRDAQRIFDDLLRKVNSGEFRPQAVWTFRRFVEDRWKPDVFPTLKYSTQKFYSNMIDAHLNPAFGDMQLRLITKDAVQSFLNAKAKNGSSWKTVKHIRTAFGTIIEAAVRDELMISNPVRKTRLPRRSQAEESLEISPATIATLIEKLPEPSRSIATLLAATGLRIGELLALRWQDVDLEKKYLWVRQTVYEGHFDEPKSKRSKRKVPLAPISLNILGTLHRPGIEPSRLIFSARNGSPLSRRNLLNRQLKPVCKSLGLTDVNWHWFRHAHATLLDSVGATLGTTQALLGHSSPDMTRGNYIESVPEDARKAVEKVGQLIGPKWTQVPDWPEMRSSVIN
jgi:integrase